MKVNNKALVLFSGGQDSTTCLAWALEIYDEVETISFDYGQRHNVELVARSKVLESIRSSFPDWDKKLGSSYVIEIDFIKKILETSLTSNTNIETKNGMPNTFVPGRNLLFFNLAATLGYKKGIEIIVGGMGQTDFSGYPDCRDNSIKSQQIALSLGFGKDFILETPLMWKNKRQVWDFAKDIGGHKLVDIIIKDTHTCYVGDRSKLNDWGYGCGNCPSCILRKSGWESWINVE
ncbi:MAG: 7-cyano-7-deazaguanine synthase QueC [Candidatus Kinetoplastibacterium crithidii]|nr:7-cyano-7-deazaguanine synthase QueC [Candidatus Kinetoplastibacterium crithidii]